MPYIKPDDRGKINQSVNSLLFALNSTTPLNVGELNYAISTLIWTLFKDNPSYTNANNIIGTIECVKLEFYRRMLAPYEDQKIAENGDILK